MTTVHKNLTGADLHEPKGADTALSGYVYVANGTGSGVWTDATSIITNTAFTTGDIKATYKTTADSTWIMMNDGTIGDGSSGGTTRANADTSALFILLWTNVSNTYAAVSGGRGGSAAADFAAHKTIALPKALGRAMFASGAGSGLTSRSLGQYAGAETYTILLANLPAYTPAGAITNGTITSTPLVSGAPAVAGTSSSGYSGGGSAAPSGTVGNMNVTSTQAASTFAGTAQGGTSTAFSILNPYFSVNFMIKL